MSEYGWSHLFVVATLAMSGIFVVDVVFGCLFGKNRFLENIIKYNNEHLILLIR